MLLEIFKNMALVVGILLLCVIFIAIIKTIIEAPKRAKEKQELDKTIEDIAKKFVDDLFKDIDKEDK